MAANEGILATPRPPRAGRVRFLAILAIIATTALATGYIVAGRLSPTPPDAPQVMGMVWPREVPIAPFELNDSDGGRFSRDDLLGRWSVLFFGYTHCPDICPGTLSALAGAHRIMRSDSPDAPVPQTVFVSVDPDRDRPEAITRYATWFEPTFRGVTGSNVELRMFSAMVGIGYGRTVVGDSDEYTISHSSSVLVIDPRANLVASLPMPHHPEDLARDLTRIFELVGGG